MSEYSFKNDIIRKDIIQLSQGQNAEPNTCGSCKFFKRYDDGNGGYNTGACTFIFPPQVALGKQTYNDRDEEYTDSRQCADTYSCHLYQSNNKEYGKIKYWKA